MNQRFAGFLKPFVTKTLAELGTISARAYGAEWRKKQNPVTREMSQGRGRGTAVMTKKEILSFLAILRTRNVGRCTATRRSPSILGKKKWTTSCFIIFGILLALRSFLRRTAIEDMLGMVRILRNEDFVGFLWEFSFLGTLCGANKMCLNRKCVPIRSVYSKKEKRDFERNWSKFYQ